MEFLNSFAMSENWKMLIMISWSSLADWGCLFYLSNPQNIQLIRHKEKHQILTQSNLITVQDNCVGANRRIDCDDPRTLFSQHIIIYYNSSGEF